ncbi:hypothetical protein [Rugamonas sp. DEMB1]|uniref:hypothetical protein n=1 Tax=Rugamonas sp. DEMB1 TaxID=3039386 RepID=UPI00244B66E4|nr:hypothetical protein [Rugamonas sp. DEMB1]WGG51812.1 hypothetical protein QC826_06220 [Rugamonas sp. DEMB1]
MRTFPMLETEEARQVAEGTVQTVNALICCLALKGLDLAEFLDDLEAYRETCSGSLNKVADEMLSRSVLSLRRTVRDLPQKNA